MQGSDENEVKVSDGSSLRTLFPGYYPPTVDERGRVYKSGLVSLDANALLDLYRLTPLARDEYFRVLETVRSRIFIAHQAALEFHRNRIKVFDLRVGEIEKECAELEKKLQGACEVVQRFANRYQIDVLQKEDLLQRIDELSRSLVDSIRAAGRYDVDRSEVRAATDSVLSRLSRLIEGRIGRGFSGAVRDDAIKEAARRKKDSIPPGYMDNKDDGLERDAGDFIIWRELLDEAKVQRRPVLLISNENKEDWVMKGGQNKEILGPRSELVLEMLTDAGCEFHMVTVVGFLKEAQQHLDAAVSDATILEAESLPSEDEEVGIEMAPIAEKTYSRMTPDEMAMFSQALSSVISHVRRGKRVDSHPAVRVDRKYPGLYLLRWGPDRLARIGYRRFGQDGGISLFVANIIRRPSEISEKHSDSDDA